MSTGQPGESPAGVRFVTDADGVNWTIWEVKPRLHSATVPLITSLPALSDELRDGWLTFQSETDRRRLVPTPAGWNAMSDEALLQLLGEARRQLPGRGRLIE